MILIPCSLVLLAILALALCDQESIVEPVAFAMPSLGGCEYCGCEFSHEDRPEMQSSECEGICVGCAESSRKH